MTKVIRVVFWHFRSVPEAGGIILLCRLGYIARLLTIVNANAIAVPSDRHGVAHVVIAKHAGVCRTGAANLDLRCLRPSETSRCEFRDIRLFLREGLCQTTSAWRLLRYRHRFGGDQIHQYAVWRKLR